MAIQLDQYGFMFDMGDFIYVSLSWAPIILSVVGVTLYKVIKRKRKK